MMSEYSQLQLNKLLIKKEADDKFIKGAQKLYDKYDLFCVELAKKPLQIEVAFSHLQEAKEWSDVSKWWHRIEFGVKSGVGVDKTVIEQAATKYFSLLQNSELKTEYFSDEDRAAVRKYVVLCIACVNDMPVEQLLERFVDTFELKGLIKVWCELTNPLCLEDAFNSYCKEDGALVCVSEKKRSELFREAEVFFSSLTEDDLKEFQLRRIIRLLFKEAEPGKDFNSLVELAKSEVNALKEQGIVLNDLRLIDYALGQCKEVMSNEKTN